MSEKLVAYYRVSTEQQGQSGLGLEAQQEAVRRHAAMYDGTVIAEFKEVESGKRADRPELARALAHARRTGARLVIAKLDRLARNVAFIAAMMERGVEFVCCDNPHVNRLTLQFLAVIAENEAKQISDRTKAALAAAKARGVRLGSLRPGFWTVERKAAWSAGLSRARERSAAVRRRNARERVADLLPAMQEQRQGGMSFRAIADVHNTQGETTPKGCRWSAASVQRALRLI